MLTHLANVLRTDAVESLHFPSGGQQSMAYADAASNTALLVMSPRLQICSSV